MDTPKFELRNSFLKFFNEELTFGLTLTALLNGPIVNTTIVKYTLTCTAGI